MLMEGIAPAIIENVGRQCGMPMGPLEVSDSVGLDTALKIGKANGRARCSRTHKKDPRAGAAVVARRRQRPRRPQGRQGLSTSTAKTASRRASGRASPQRIEVKTKECPPELKAELTKRFLFRQCIEVARCFEEGVITDPRDADVGSILAWGFAPYSGGCVSYIDLFWGTKSVRRRSRSSRRRNTATASRPTTLLRDMAAKGETFYELVRQAKSRGVSADLALSRGRGRGGPRPDARPLAPPSSDKGRRVADPVEGRMPCLRAHRPRALGHGMNSMLQSGALAALSSLLSACAHRCAASAARTSSTRRLGCWRAGRTIRRFTSPPSSLRASGDVLTLQYDDGDTGAQPSAKRAPAFDWEPGTALECRWTDGVFYPGVIAQMDAARVQIEVLYDDAQAVRPIRASCRGGNRSVRGRPFLFGRDTIRASAPRRRN